MEVGCEYYPISTGARRNYGELEVGGMKLFTFDVRHADNSVTQETFAKSESGRFYPCEPDGESVTEVLREVERERKGREKLANKNPVYAVQGKSIIMGQERHTRPSRADAQ